MKNALFASRDGSPAINPISPARELGAYEEMWLQPGATFKNIAERFAKDPTALPSDFVAHSIADARAREVFQALKTAGVHGFGIRINHAGDYPERLRDAQHPVELLYYRGTWELSETRGVAVVGSRRASAEGLKRAARIARELVGAGFTVVSGLAAGIDTAAHRATLEAKGRTIAVIGTPLGVTYPKENAELQAQIASDYLLISQVPVLRYSKQAVPQNRLFFPERNITMSALTEATIIVEAGETSGTLTQARAALHQRRKLFILDSCFARSDITWPATYEARGAIRVKKSEDIWDALGDHPASTNR
ncbi:MULTISPECIES: DNA-processing protein DprA [unclassified Bradyrhizobium]|uniref:DNA-processing protein DprA n=1 Tax=unclassified Bradyrhizobium TaxID=2631580 RepID=UPI0020B3C9BA|nr:MULTISPECIES: DNA-processing protein DprA [unclassified Bradyrhizobium]MCP3380428.1 DNA-protecting protein DprA [Bradyrhizobium sp. CCGUVB4N]MCP3441283.1 DNA-protecting protein DprA [Bradyrhizobium sp. CCGUVB14]